MKKILVIEDDPDVIEVLKETLNDYEVKLLHEPIGDVGEFQKIALEFSPDLILLDLMMPKIDGFQILKKLKGDFSSKTIPVIIITGYYSIANIRKATLLGADDFLTKPFDLDEITTKIKRWIG